MAKKPAPPPVDPDYVPPNPDEVRTARALQVWSYDDTGFDLSVEEQLFTRSYMIDRNPIAALRRLGYGQETSRLKVISKQILSNPEVQGAVEYLAKRMMDNLEITAERVNRRIAAVAFFDPRSVMEFDNNGVVMLNSRFWTEEAASNVSSIKMGKDGIEVKFYDSLKAREMLAKQLGMQPDDDKAAQDSAAKAGAEAVFDKIMDLFDKTIPDDETKVPEITYQQATEGQLH